MNNVGMTRQTGDKCPVTGVWQAIDPKKGAFFFKEGEELPSYDGKSISWVLIEEENQEKKT